MAKKPAARLQVVSSEGSRLYIGDNMGKVTVANISINKVYILFFIFTHYFGLQGLISHF